MGTYRLRSSQWLQINTLLLRAASDFFPWACIFSGMDRQHCVKPQFVLRNALLSLHSNKDFYKTGRAVFLCSVLRHSVARDGLIAHLLVPYDHYFFRTPLAKQKCRFSIQVEVFQLIEAPLGLIYGSSAKGFPGSRLTKISTLHSVVPQICGSC